MAPPPRPATYSIVSLKRWSCKSKEIPGTYHLYNLGCSADVEKLSRTSNISTSTILTIPVSHALQIFDSLSDVRFAVFSSPLPNPQLWAGPTLGYLQTYECFANGGWWHDPSILSATGDGLEKEESKAWKGWWNEAIVRTSPPRRRQKY